MEKNKNKSFKTFEQYLNSKEHKMLRFGQAFCNYFSINNPKLYYCENTFEAIDIIKNNETLNKLIEKENKMSNLKKSVYTLIEQISEAEKVTKKALSVVSRELLYYVPDSQDIEAVNLLISKLTPMNKQVAIMYFSHFLPWQSEKDNNKKHIRFGKKYPSNMKVDKKLKLIDEWLKEETNNIWVWSNNNVKVSEKNLATPISKAIENALNGHEKSNTPPLTIDKIVEAIFVGGVSIDNILDVVSDGEEDV